MTTLLEKLRYKPGMRVCVLDAPAGFEAELHRLPRDVSRAKALRGKFDLVQAFFTRKAQLTRQAPVLARALEPGGILWLSYPKGRGLGTDLDRDLIRELVATMGLEAVAQVAVDEVWSALRCKVV